MKKLCLLVAAMGLLALCAADAFASIPVLDTSCVYRLYYQSGSNWLEVFPGDAPSYDSSTLWKYSYTMYNHSNSETNIDWMHVFYDGTDMTGITQTGIPTGWTSDGIGTYDSGLPTGIFATKVQWGSDDIRYYYIAPGSNLSGFEYTFNWQDETHLPGTQHYQAGNGSSESGTTTPVPEPATATLLGLGLTGLVGKVVKRRFMA